jgi:hypothetical protein
MTERQTLIADIAQILGVDQEKAARVVDAFDEFVVEPLANRLGDTAGTLDSSASMIDDLAELLAPSRRRPTDAYAVAQRNPFVYASLGITDIDQWVRQVIQDKSISALEGLMGNFLEEVARIVSGGIKPGSGVDLQIEKDRDVALYALQSASNTKNAGGRRSDLAGLEKAAGALRAQRRHVTKNVVILFGRVADSERDGVRWMSSQAFWEEITGDRGFAGRLLRANVRLSSLIHKEAEDRITAVSQQAKSLFSKADGSIDWDKVFNSPRRPRPRRAKETS